MMSRSSDVTLSKMFNQSCKDGDCYMCVVEGLKSALRVSLQFE